jgi:hypothetical protein
VKKNGSIYVVVVLAALTGYFVYQWWFNPNRIIKQRLGEVAATLSAPADEQQLSRFARVAKLRRFVDEQVRVSLGRTQYSHDDALGLAAGWQIPPGGWNLDFADVDVRVNPGDTAHAFATAQMTTEDLQTHQPQSLGSVEVTFALAKRNSEWVITEAEVKHLQTTQ